MYNIRHFCEYVTDGTNVYIKNRMFPLKPRIHPVKGFEQYLLRQDDGVTQFVSKKTIDNLTVKLDRVKSRSKIVSHIPTGKMYTSMKEACDVHKISAAKLKTNKDFLIV